MHLFTETAFVTLLLLSDATATALETITPCPAAFDVAPITVTAQFQDIPTCTASATVCNVQGKCSVKYDYETYKYVSTTIPCALKNGEYSSTLVTEMIQPITISASTMTITNVIPVPSRDVRWHRFGKHQTFTTLYESKVRNYIARFDEIGPLAMPGYAGNALCESCKGTDGQSLQNVKVTECRTDSLAHIAICKESFEVWGSLPETSVVEEATAVCATKTAVFSAGLYTYSFVATVPATTITIPSKTVTVTANDGHGSYTSYPVSPVTIEPQVWTAYVTKECNGPTVFDFEVTVTDTVTRTMPVYTYSEQSSTEYTKPYSSPSSTTLSSEVLSSNPVSSQIVIGSNSGSLTSTSSITTNNGIVVNPVLSSTGFTMSVVSSSSFIFTTFTASTSFSTYTTSSISFTTSGAVSSDGSPTSTPSASPSAQGFRIVIQSPQTRARYKRQSQMFLYFLGDIAYTTADENHAAIFNSDSNYHLMLGTQYLGSNNNAGVSQFIKANYLPTVSGPWNVNNLDMTVSLQSALRFCISNDARDEVYIVFSEEPGSCNTVILKAQPIGSSTTTSASTEIATTTNMPESSSVSTTSTIPSLESATLQTISSSISESTSTSTMSSYTMSTTSSTTSETESTISSILSDTTSTITTTSSDVTSTMSSTTSDTALTSSSLNSETTSSSSSISSEPGVSYEPQSTVSTASTSDPSGTTSTAPARTSCVTHIVDSSISACFQEPDYFYTFGLQRANYCPVVGTCSIDDMYQRAYTQCLSNPQCAGFAYTANKSTIYQAPPSGGMRFVHDYALLQREQGRCEPASPGGATYPCNPATDCQTPVGQLIAMDCLGSVVTPPPAAAPAPSYPACVSSATVCSLHSIGRSIIEQGPRATTENARKAAYAYCNLYGYRASVNAPNFGVGPVLPCGAYAWTNGTFLTYTSMTLDVLTSAPQNCDESEKVTVYLSQNDGQCVPDGCSATPDTAPVCTGCTDGDYCY